jgi:2,5-diketo-D-gluconate reductase A
MSVTDSAGGDGNPGGETLIAPRLDLADSTSIPMMGLGTATMDDEEAADVVALASRVGYRMIDTGAKYENETGVGRGIAESGIPREDITVITKLRGSDHGYKPALRACESSLQRLGLDYLDLYLIHWPMPTIDKYVESWKAMIELRERGLARSIGVSNFLLEHIDRLQAETGVLPSVNQIEMHPRVPHAELREGMTRLGVTTIASSPFDRGSEVLTAPEILAIAESHGVTAGQTILRWHTQLDAVPIPRARSSHHLRANLDIFDFELTDGELETINSLYPPERPHFDPATHEEF